jgi:hypothetical protein
MSSVTPITASQPDSCVARAPLSRIIHSQSRRVAVLTAKRPLVALNLSLYQPTTRLRTDALSSASSSRSALQRSPDPFPPIQSSSRSGSREARPLFQKSRGLLLPYTQPTALLATALSAASAGSSRGISKKQSQRVKGGGVNC